MFISSNNKNPVINCERNNKKHQKPQIFLGSKITLKCMKKGMRNENKWKRRGIKVLPVYEDKNLAKESEENDKKLIGSLDRSKRERKKFLKKFESDRSRENSLNFSFKSNIFLTIIKKYLDFLFYFIKSHIFLSIIKNIFEFFS